MSLRPIQTPNAPQAIGPYSQAMCAGGFVFCSGQIPIDPSTGKLVDGDIGAQTQRVMQNLKAVLATAGSDFSKVVKSTIYLKDLNHFQAVNTVYGEYFTPPFPARVTIQAAKLPLDAEVEIDLIAKVDA